MLIIMTIYIIMNMKNMNMKNMIMKVKTKIIMMTLSIIMMNVVVMMMKMKIIMFEEIRLTMMTEKNMRSVLKILKTIIIMIEYECE
jgi:hypothetical protein